MRWLAPLWFAEIHREVYVALLHSWIPHGHRGEFARRVGITREYLSYLCALEEEVERRLPSLALAKRMAAELSAPRDIKQSLVEHIELARVKVAETHYHMRTLLKQQRIAEILAEMEASHRQATFGGDALTTSRAYRFTRDASLSLLQKISPERYPVTYAQTCMYLHDAQCVLDRAEEALRWAKIADLVLSNVEEVEAGVDQFYADNIYINTIRGQAVAYNNLNLPRKVPEILERVRATRAFREQNDFWMPLVNRDTLSNMARTPRFSIRHAKRLAQMTEAHCEHNADVFTLFIAQETWLRCLVAHAEWKQAERVLEEEIQLLPRLPYVGFLHKALLLKTYAFLAWQQKDYEMWQKQMGLLLPLLPQAGLKHQWREISR